MEGRKLVPGSLFKQPDGRVYQVRELAKHIETGEDMLVYQEMQPPYQIWVRSLGSGTRDDAKQEKKTNRDTKEASSVTEDTLDQADFTKPQVQISDEEFKQILVNGQAEKFLAGKMPDEEIARRGFLALLDTEGYREKRQIMTELEPYLDELYLNNLAVALDIVLEEGTRQEHFDAILHCLQTFEKYEGRRLRS